MTGEQYERRGKMENKRRDRRKCFKSRIINVLKIVSGTIVSDPGQKGNEIFASDKFYL